MQTCYLEEGSYRVGGGTTWWALLSSYRLSIATIPLSVMVWPQFAMQILTAVLTPKISSCHGGLGPISITVLLGTTQVSLRNGISFHPMALAWYMSATEIRQTERPCYGNMFRNRRNHFQQCRLIMQYKYTRLVNITNFITTLDMQCTNTKQTT